MFSVAQTLTETQKQEALQTATKFCDLFMRYCNGERVLMSQINSLCSGANCTAYDDVKANKEIALRNYLFTIQQSYPQRMDVKLSTPSFSNCEIYYDYSFDISLSYSSFEENNSNGMGVALLPTLKKDMLKNVIIIFNVNVDISPLGKNVTRKLFYSTSYEKITAFTHNSSPNLSYAKALNAFAQGKYSQSLAYSQEAIENADVTFSKKKGCYLGAYLASLMIQDYESALKYATLYGDIGYILNVRGQLAFSKGDVDEAYNCYKQLETELIKGTNSLYPLCGVYYMLGNFHSYPSSSCSHHNSTLSASYFKKSYAENGDFSPNSAYMLYYFWILYQHDKSYGISDKDVSYTDALNYLRFAAKLNYPPAYLLLAIAEHKDTHNNTEADKWYNMAASNGNALAMALYGKFLIESASSNKTNGDIATYTKQRNGTLWLQRALRSKTLEKDIKDFFEAIPRQDINWPYSKVDVEKYLKEISQ